MNETKYEIITTGLSCTKKTVLWRIEEFDAFRMLDNASLSSKTIQFTAKDSSGLETQWSCYLSKESVPQDGEYRDFIGIFIRLENVPKQRNALGFGFSCKQVWVSFQFKVNKTNEPNQTYFDRRSRLTNFVTEKGQPIGGMGWKQFIAEAEAAESLPLVDGALLVEVHLSLYSLRQPSRPIISMPQLEQEFKPKFAEKLQKDLKKLLSAFSPNDRDRTIKIVTFDETEFIVNRDIISVRSPKLEEEIKTSIFKPGIAHVNGIKGRVLAVILEYIYSGTLHEDWKKRYVLVSLICAAQEYDLPVLLQFLDLAAGSVCSKENAAKLLLVAREMGLKNAEKGALNFIRDNFSDKEKHLLIATCVSLDLV